MKFLLWCFCLCVLSAPVFAADKKQEETPVTKLNAASKKMLDGLNQNQTKQFAAIRNSQGIIRAVEDVEGNMNAALKSCSGKNPEFAYTMKTRVDEWKAAVDPVLSEARSRLEEMIKLQDFAKPQDVRNYLKQVDTAVAYKARGVEIIPITEKSECKKLLGKMDETQDDMVKLMVESLELKKPLVQ